MKSNRIPTLRSSAGGPRAGAGALVPGAGALITAGRMTTALLGRPFVHPAIDYLVIGGGLSLLLAPLIAIAPAMTRPADTTLLAWVLLLSNSAHFAASSARLYGRPGVARSMPFVTIGLPFVVALMFAAGLAWPRGINPLLETIYLTWSPYHYAAQAYGIAIFYAQRAGRRLDAADRRALRLVAMVPFVYMLTRAVPRLLPGAAGFFPSSSAPLAGLGGLMVAAGFAAPLALWFRLWARDGAPLPLLTLLPIVSNAIWFFVLNPFDAFLWATIFHGAQYVALALAFRAGEARSVTEPAAPGGPLRAVAGFYLLSVVLGYSLFILLPAAGVALGGAYGDSRLLAVSLVNIHHFIVDARVWRPRDDAATRRIVEGVL